MSGAPFQSGPKSLNINNSLPSPQPRLWRRQPSLNVCLAFLFKKCQRHNFSQAEIYVHPIWRSPGSWLTRILPPPSLPQISRHNQHDFQDPQAPRREEIEEQHQQNGAAATPTGSREPSHHYSNRDASSIRPFKIVAYKTWWNYLMYPPNPKKFNQIN